MSCRLASLLASVGLCAAVMLTGCGQSAQLALQFTPQTSTAYEVTTEVTKDFRFEQPTLDKLREEQSTTVVRVGFTQTITGVDADGIASADVTIDTLSVYVTNKNDVRLSFDSAAEADRGHPLYGLIGQRYSIRLSPQGKVVGLDNTAARAAIAAGPDSRMAERIVGEEGIRERHEIPALQDALQNASPKQSWTQTVASPPGLLAPKNYRKVYTLTGTEMLDGQKIAVIEMAAMESADAAGGAASATSMGVFSKMFDNEDAYTGRLRLNQTTGQVVDYQETLVSTYLAQEMPANAPADKGPDTLTMRFTHRISMKQL